MIYAISHEHGNSDYYFTSTRTNCSCTPHAHSHVELIFVLDGQLSLSVDDTVCLVDKGNVAIIMPYQVHYYTPKNDNIIFHIACPPEYIGEYNQIFSGKRISPFTVPSTPAMEALVKELSIIDEEMRFDRSQIRYSFKGKALFYAAMSEFLSNCTLLPTEHISYDVYRKAIVYITEHYTEDISLSVVAKYCGVTSVHLSRIMNSRSKTGFSDIVNSLRVVEAKRLLEQTTLPISRIALDVGFGTIRSFNRTFLKYFNCNPKDLRLHAHSDNPIYPTEPCRNDI